MAKIKLYGLVGKNISYSFSAEYFNSKFKKERISNSEYINFDIDTVSEFAKILEHNHNLNGLNVTIPYKQAIIPYLDSLSKKAIQIGAVNTIKINKKGKLKGYNTDWYGFYKALSPMLKSHHTKALILGTGGASKAIEFALKKMRIDYNLVSRTSQENVYSYKQLTKEIMEQHTIIINTTPLGTFPNIEDSPEIPYNYITPNHIAFDLIYNPEITSFLKLAALNGAQTQNGYLMLQLQAEKAWKIWNKKSFIPNLSRD